MADDGSKPQSAVTWVRKNSKHTGSMRTILIMLADFIDDGNNCPSQKELAAAAGLSTDTVRRVLGELVKDRTIIITKAGGKKVRGGQRDCYAVNRRAAPATTSLDATGSQQPPCTQQHGRPIPGGTQQPGRIPEDAPVYVSDAAGESALSVKQKAKEKDKKLTLPAKAGKENAGATSEKPVQETKQPTAAGLEWSDLITAIGDIFKAFGVEAKNYANMLTGRAKKDVWGQCAFEVPVSAADLRTWWRWYKAKNPTVDRVKEPPKVYSSITEWRNLPKPPDPAIRRTDPESGVTRTLSEDFLNTLRPSWKAVTR